MTTRLDSRFDFQSFVSKHPFLSSEPLSMLRLALGTRDLSRCYSMWCCRCAWLFSRARQWLPLSLFVFNFLKSAMQAAGSVKTSVAFPGAGGCVLQYNHPARCNSGMVIVGVTSGWLYKRGFLSDTVKTWTEAHGWEGHRTSFKSTTVVLTSRHVVKLPFKYLCFHP
jgi:hypothetical protein